MLKATVTFDNHTDDALSGIGKAVNISVQKSIAVMERNIKVEAPVKHGFLRRSITSRMTGLFEGQVDTASLVDGKEITYAKFLEYGTRYIAPRAFFRRGVANSEQRIQSIFDDELGKKVV